MVLEEGVRGTGFIGQSRINSLEDFVDGDAKIEQTHLATMLKPHSTQCSITSVTPNLWRHSQPVDGALGQPQLFTVTEAHLYQDGWWSHVDRWRVTWQLRIQERRDYIKRSYAPIFLRCHRQNGSDARTASKR